MKSKPIPPAPAIFAQHAQQIYDQLQQTYGQLAWWPANSPFEIIIGAILGQNTTWTNVEKAITQLTAHNILTAETILTTPLAQLKELIRPAGFFNAKSQYLRTFCQWFCDVGGFDYLHQQPTDTLRQQLLGLTGIGRETADDILLYCLARPVFVIDAYTRRLFSRYGLIDGDEPYEWLRQWCEISLPKDVNDYQQYHALIVEQAKQACRKKPICTHCCLQTQCKFNNNSR